MTRLALKVILTITLSALLWPHSPVHAEKQQEILLRYFDIPRGRLAFTYEKDEQKDIWVIDFDLLEIRPLVKTPRLDEYPAWSPDGKLLAFYSDVSGDREIYTVKSDGTGLTRLTNSKGVDEDPSWSPDGTKIVFHSERLGKGSNIFVMNSDGSHPKALTQSSKQNSVPRWSPDGTKIIYSTNSYWPGWDLVLYDFATQTFSILTSGYRSFCRANWASDSKSFVFSHGAGSSIDLWAHEKGKKGFRQLLERPGRDYDALLIEDQGKLIFAGELEPEEGRYELFVYDTKIQKAFQLTQSKGSLRYPSYTPVSFESATEGKEAPEEKEKNEE